MTNQFFTHPKTLEGLHKGPRGAPIDAYAALLHEQGYGGQGACRQIRWVAELNRWRGGGPRGQGCRFAKS